MLRLMSLFGQNTNSGTRPQRIDKRDETTKTPLRLALTLLFLFAVLGISMLPLLLGLFW
jgi:hypothetical protein